MSGRIQTYIKIFEKRKHCQMFVLLSVFVYLKISHMLVACQTSIDTCFYGKLQRKSFAGSDRNSGSLKSLERISCTRCRHVRGKHVPINTRQVMLKICPYTSIRVTRRVFADFDVNAENCIVITTKAHLVLDR